MLAPGSIIHVIPDELGPEAAVGLPLAANGLQWVVRKGGLSAGDRLLILGCGPQGLASILMAQAAGAREIVITGLKRDITRLELAQEFGARAISVSPDTTAEELMDQAGSDFDVVLDVSGATQSVALAPALVRRQGTFVLAGLVGSGRTVPMRTDDLVWREIRVQGVLSKDERAIRTALDLIVANRQLGSALSRLITHVFSLDEAYEAITAVERDLPGFVKAAVDPRAESSPGPRAEPPALA